MRGQAVLTSSASDEWCTPRRLYDRLDKEFGFKWDAAADDGNALASLYYTKESNALAELWDGIVWCNPPFSKVDKFVRHGCESMVKGGALVVMLVAARTDTRWWHDCVLPYADEIRFVRGRLRFSGAQGNAPFPCAVIVFKKTGGGSACRPRVSSLVQ